MAIPFDLGTAATVYLAVALIFAAFVRGFTGFGFSAIFIIAATFVTNPLPLIPVVFTCEIAMTGFQARGIWRDVDWGRTGLLLLGATIAVVPSVTLMTRLDEAQARLAISALILVLGLILLSGWQLRRVLGRGGFLSMGIVSGMANSAGVGGLPVAAFMSAQPIAPAVFRATIIAFLTGLDFVTLPVMAANGLVGPETPVGIALAFPFLGLGIWLGTLAYRRSSPERFRRSVILLLCLLAAANIARTAF